MIYRIEILRGGEWQEVEPDEYVAERRMEDGVVSSSLMYRGAPVIAPWRVLSASGVIMSNVLERLSVLHVDGIR